MVSLDLRRSLRRHGPYLLGLAAPLAVWMALWIAPDLDVQVTAGRFHLWLMVVVSTCALAVALLAARASARVRQPGVVLLACGCLVVGLLLLGHGLTTPFVLGQPLNEWVGRLNYIGLGFFTITLTLAACNGARAWLRPIGRHPNAALVAAGVPAAALTVLVALSPTALAGDAPLSFESTAKASIAYGAVACLIPVSWAHWRRYRLGLDIVQMSLSLAALMTAAAMLSMHLGDVWRISWWNYHGALLAGFAGVSYAIFRRWARTRTAAGVLEAAFEDDPLTLIAHNYPDQLTDLVEEMEHKDPYTHGHSARTAELAVTIGVRMGLDSDDLRTLAQGAYLHDIGKLDIPDAILNKPGSLSDEEWAVIETHPVRGDELAREHRVLAPCLPIIRHHHERFDGQGYPDGLAADHIPLLARVAAVADVWDALTSDRSYRPGWSPQEALDHIVDGAGRHLDPRVVAVLLEIAEESGYRPSGVGGDAAQIESSTADCHESGPNRGELTHALHRILEDH